MKLMDVYEKIQSPFSDEAIKSIIAGKRNGMRNNLDYEELNRDFKARNDLFVDIYNDWVNEFFSLNDAQLASLVGKEMVELAKKLREKLKALPPVKNFVNLKKAEDILYDNEFKSVTEKCYWDKGMVNGSILLSSNRISCKNENLPVLHILSLEISQEFLNRFFHTLYSELKEKNIACNLRFSQETTVEIHANNENLGAIVEVLEELRVKNPDIYSKIKENRDYIGKIDNKIGFRNVGDDSQNTIIDTIAKVTPQRIIVDNVNTRFRYGKSVTDITNILKSRLASFILDKLEQDLKKGYKVDYTFEELKSHEFQAKVLSEAGSVVNAWLAKIKNGEELIEVNAFILNRNKETIILSLSPNDLKIVLAVIPEIRDYVKRFIETCLKERGYDEKSCISKDAIEKMEEYDKGLAKPTGTQNPIKQKNVLPEVEKVIINPIEKPKNLEPVIPKKVEQPEKPTFVHRPIVKPKTITSTPYQLPTEPNVTVKVNPVLKAQTITIFYPEVDGGAQRFFIRREDATNNGINPIINPYEQFVPITLEEIARLNAAPNIQLKKSLYNFPKPELRIYFEKRESGNCYLTNDYVIDSIGLKGVLKPDEIICGREIALNEAQYAILRTYYNVNLLPVFGTFEPPSEDFDDSGYNLDGSSIIQDDPIKIIR